MRTVRVSGFTCLLKAVAAVIGAGLPSVINPSSAEDKQPAEAGTQWALFTSGIA